MRVVPRTFSPISLISYSGHSRALTNCHKVVRTSRYDNNYHVRVPLDRIDEKIASFYVISNNSFLIEDAAVITRIFFSERMTPTSNTIENQFAHTRISNGLRNIQTKHVDLRDIHLRRWIPIGWAAIGMLSQEQGADRRTVRRFQV